MTYREKQKAKAIVRRSCNIFQNQKRRAKEYSCELPYTLEQLRELIAKAIGRPCHFCHQEITASNFGVDHSEPVSRGGQHCLENICICCMGCNQVKGNMNEGEFYQLMNLLNDFHPTARRSVLARLKAGGKIVRG